MFLFKFKPKLLFDIDNGFHKQLVNWIWVREEAGVNT
jgi:hypothetical protein